MSLPENTNDLPFPIESERLILRGLRPDDLEATLAHRGHSIVARYTAPPMSRKKAREHIANMQHPMALENGKWCCFGITKKEDDHVMGEIAFRMESRDDLRAEVGYRLHPDFQGKGFAFESMEALREFLFNQTPLVKLVAYCSIKNKASFGLLERLGFQREGKLRRHMMLGRVWHDFYLYSFLRKDMES